MFAEWSSTEASFDMSQTISWMQQHAEVPVAAVGLYLGFIFTVPQMLPKPLNVKLSFAMWNLLLSVFSFMGVTRIVPHLLRTVSQEGFIYSVCEEPTNWYSKGPSGLWMTLFVLSKFPELGDTVFLILRKKPVIFLHWFHHTTVLLYCWHSYATEAPQALYFIAMNYSVHAVMYGYYCLMALRMKPKWLPPMLITVFQLSQAFRNRAKAAAAAENRAGRRAKMCDEEVSEAENDVSSLSMSFLTVNVVRYALSGVLPNEEGLEEPENVHPLSCTLYLFGIGILLALLASVLAMVVARPPRLVNRSRPNTQQTAEK